MDWKELCKFYRKLQSINCFKYNFHIIEGALILKSGSMSISLKPFAINPMKIEESSMSSKT